MLTAHTLSIENVKRSYKEGAASYIPKEEMVNITTFLDDVMEAKEKVFGGVGFTDWKPIFKRDSAMIGKRKMKNFGGIFPFMNKPSTTVMVPYLIP